MRTLFSVILSLLLVTMAGGVHLVGAVSVNVIYDVNQDDPDNFFMEQAKIELETHLTQVDGNEVISINLSVDPDHSELLEKKREAFKLIASGNSVQIIGKTPIAVRHGAYTYLDAIGFRWYFSHPSWTVIPESLPQISLNKIEEPYFMLRRLGNPIGYLVGSRNGNLHNRQWVKRNRMAGDISLATRHSWSNFLPHNELPPEALCERKGGGTQRRPDHPAVIDKANNYARNYFKNPLRGNVYTGDKQMKMSVPISPPDGNMIWCEDWRVDGKYSGQVITDKVFGLTNEVAKMLQLEHPGKYASVLNYSWYSSIPTIPLEPNVFVVVTDFSRGTSLSTNERLKQIKALGVLTGFYGYFDVWQWWKDRIPPPGKYNKFYTDLQNAIDAGADSFYAEGSDNWAPKGRLYWMVSKRTWDPNQQIVDLLDDFYTNAFGPAREPMKRYYTRFDTEPHTERAYYLAFEDLRSALDQAAGQDLIVERILQVISHTYLWWKWGENIKAGHKNFTNSEEAKSLYRILWKIRDYHLVTFRKHEEAMRILLQNTYGVSDSEIEQLQNLQVPVSGNDCAIDHVQCRTRYLTNAVTLADAISWLHEGLNVNESLVQKIVIPAMDPLDFQPFQPALSDLPRVQRYRNVRGSPTEVLVPSDGSEIIKAAVATTGWVEWEDPSGKVVFREDLSNLCVSGGGCNFSQPGKQYELTTSTPGIYILRVGGWSVVDVIDHAAAVPGPHFAQQTRYDTYFYVPEETPIMLLGTFNGRTGGVQATLTLPDGSTLEFEGPSGINNEWPIQKPQSGIWRIQLNMPSNIGGRFWLYGIPALVWHDPKYLLIPAKPEPNESPIVDAGADQSITLPQVIQLSGTVTDDGLPNPPGSMISIWTMISGPGDVIFKDGSSLNSTAQISRPGSYVLKLSVQDGAAVSSDQITVTVSPPPHALYPVFDPIDPTLLILAIRSEEFQREGDTVEPEFHFRSGPRTLRLNRLIEDSSIHYTKIPSGSLTEADFSELRGGQIDLILNAKSLSFHIERNVIMPHLGGRVRETLGVAEVIIAPHALSQEGRIRISAPSFEQFTLRNTALQRQHLVSLGPERDITLETDGTLESATLKLPFDRSLIPKGRSSDEARIAYYDPLHDKWEILPQVQKNNQSLQTHVSHFSIYMPVLRTPDETSVLKEVFAYPNPAVTPEEPTIRAKIGRVDSVEITIFDISGQKVHSATLSGVPTGIVDGSYYYDYTWTDRKASGVYFAVIHGKSSEGTVRGRTKFAVVK